MAQREALLEPLLRQFRLRKISSCIPKNSILLDVGCGKNATFLKFISGNINYGIGVDFKVNDSKFSNIQTTQLKFDSKLPFDDNSFSIVTMLAVLEHIENEEQVLKEVYRVLTPEGKLIITVPSVWSQPILEFLAYNLRIVSEDEIRDHKRYYNRDKLKEILINHVGFSQFNHKYFQFWMNNFCTVVKCEIS
jgi:ubiquinone/menaquinone biosynthesis C-methylase UbiE